MSLEKEYYVTIAMDLIAVLLLLGLCAVPKDDNEKDGTGRRLFASMVFFIMVGVVFELITWFLPEELPVWLYIMSIIFETIVELCITVVLLLLFLYTDYELYGSPDHLRRHIAAYLFPAGVLIVVSILTVIRKLFFSYHGSVVYDIYTYTEYLELIYLFLTALHYLSHCFRFGTKRFFHPLTIYVPILCGALFTFFTDFTGIFLGFSFGLVLLVFSKMDSWRFMDRETLFYNRFYLPYILSQVAEGREVRKSAIFFNASGDAKALSDILREELPVGSEVISMGEGCYIFMSKKENQAELRALSSLVSESIEEYDEEHPDSKIEAEVSFKVFSDYKDMEETLGRGA